MFTASYMTTQEVASALSISPKRVRTMIRDGRLAPVLDLGDEYRIPQEALDAFIARATIPTNPTERRAELSMREIRKRRARERRLAAA